MNITVVLIEEAAGKILAIQLFPSASPNLRCSKKLAFGPHR